MASRFTLCRGVWYGWEMFPGYLPPMPYASPILVERVHPHGEGSRRFDLQFLNLNYAAGVQDFHVTLRILKRARTYMVVDLEKNERAAVMLTLSAEWLQTRFPGSGLGRIRHDEDPQQFLEALGPAR